MSADRQRLKSAIQRIAKEDPEIRNLLGEGQNKGGQPSSSGVGTSEAEESRLCCDGSTSDNANPGTGERDPDAESQDGLDSDDPAKLGSGDGTLSGVTDCATGEPVCFDGSGFIPPEGWDDPKEPPIDPEYEEGVYWVGIVAGSQSTFQTPSAAKSFVCPPLCDCITSTGGSQATCDTCSSEDEGFFTTCGGENYSWGSRQCSDDPDPICDEPPPLAETWPEDGCTNLAIISGTIVGSKYDPENDGSYSKPMSEIQLCDAQGNQISIRPAGTGVLPTGEQTSVPERITGGWKTFNSTTSNGYLYDSSGKQIAHIDGNEYSDPTI